MAASPRSGRGPVACGAHCRREVGWAAACAAVRDHTALAPHRGLRRHHRVQRDVGAVTRKRWG
eukprot:6176667-Pleurochrysis_carterae.AAC.1